MDLIFGKEELLNKNTQQVNNSEFNVPAEQDEDEDEDLRSSDEWNMVDESKQNTDEPSQTNSYFDMLSNASTQNIIIEILNNKLHELTTKMDSIINKLDTLENKIDKLEEKQKTNDSMFNFSNEELALNNIDFQNILDSENNTLSDSENQDCLINESTQLYHNSVLNYNQPPLGLNLNMLHNVNMMNNLKNLERRLSIPKK